LVVATAAITRAVDQARAAPVDQAVAQAQALGVTALDQLINLNIQNMVQSDTGFQVATDILHRGVVVAVVALVVEELMQAVARLVDKVVEAG
jgi:hypothetical protein